MENSQETRALAKEDERNTLPDDCQESNEQSVAWSGEKDGNLSNGGTRKHSSRLPPISSPEKEKKSKKRGVKARKDNIRNNGASVCPVPSDSTNGKRGKAKDMKNTLSSTQRV